MPAIQTAKGSYGRAELDLGSKGRAGRGPVVRQMLENERPAFHFGANGSAWSLMFPIIEQSLCCKQIGSAKSLREPIVDRLKTSRSLGLKAAINQQAGMARCASQLPR